MHKISKTKAKLNIKFEIVPESLEPFFHELFPSNTEGIVKCEPSGYVNALAYAEVAERIYQIEPREDDTWVITFPKSGTTWVSEMVWLLKNNVNFKEATETPIAMRAFWPEKICYGPKQIRELQSSNPNAKKPEDYENLPSPRVIKSHLTLDLLHPNLLNHSKVIYVARNPKDVIVSYYHYHKLMKIQSFTGNFEQFVHFFMDGKVLMATPYFGHVLSAWEKRHHQNMHIIFYEDMKLNLRVEIQKAADFLGKKLTEEDLNKLEKHLHFSSFENNEAVNSNERFKTAGIANEGGKFIRKGIIGDWKTHFSPELNREVDLWIAKNLEGTHLKFITE